MDTTKPKRIYRGRKYRWNDPKPIVRARLAENGSWHEWNRQELAKALRLTQSQIEALFRDALFDAMGDTIDGIEIEMPPYLAR